MAIIVTLFNWAWFISNLSMTYHCSSSEIPLVCFHAKRASGLLFPYLVIIPEDSTDAVDGSNEAFKDSTALATAEDSTTATAATSMSPTTTPELMTGKTKDFTVTKRKTATGCVIDFSSITIT